MLDKHYKRRIIRNAYERRWIFFLLCFIVSLLTSFVPFSKKGHEVLMTLSQLKVPETKSPIQTIAASNVHTIFQIVQLGIGEGRVISKKPKPTPTPISSSQNKAQQYGKATQIDEHTWTMTLQNDPKEGSAREIFEALNSYRIKMGTTSLIWNDTLSAYATARANEFSQKGALDGHAGFMDLMNHQDGFNKLGFNSLGENSSYGYILSGTRLVEEVYAADSEHNNNQLNSGWTYVGIGVSGTATDLVFGGKKK
jgi:uncharacterized protein YkwD